jgi:hypothetical protein
VETLGRVGIAFAIDSRIDESCFWLSSATTFQPERIVVDTAVVCCICLGIEKKKNLNKITKVAVQVDVASFRLLSLRRYTVRVQLGSSSGEADSDSHAIVYSVRWLD